MANTPKPLAQATLGTTLTTLYTVPEGGFAIPSFLLVNTGGSGATMRLYAVAPEDTPAAKNAWLYDMIVESTETKLFAPGHVLDAGWTLQAVAAQQNVIGVTISGLEVTP